MLGVSQERLDRVGSEVRVHGDGVCLVPLERFSGVLHGAMAAGLVAWLLTARDPLTAFVCVLFAAKLGWEHVHGALPITSATLSLPVVHQAHTYGAIGGMLVALLLTRGRRTAAASL